jgi:hypothetical protein
MSGGHDGARGKAQHEAVRNAQDQVRRAVTAMASTAGRLAPRATLVTLSAAALAPLMPAVVGSGAVAVALAGVFGNVGSDLLAGAIERALGRRHEHDNDEAASLDGLQQDLADELTRLLDTQSAPDVAALQSELLSVLDAVGGIDVAIETATGQVRSDLTYCFDELLANQLTTLGRLDVIEAEQRRQGDWLREVRDRLRRRDALSDESAGGAASPTPSAAFSPTVVMPGARLGDPTPRVWAPGAEVAVDGRAYLLHALLLGEDPSRDGGSIVRRARGLRLVPAPVPGSGYVWLRQVAKIAGTPGDRRDHRALQREHDLLGSLGRRQGLPRAEHFANSGATTTSVLVWPASRSRRVPCDTLGDLVRLAGTPVDDTWRLSRLLTGLAGLCDTLALLHEHGVAHRDLSPSSLIALDDGRLVLRDLGLAAREPVPGEGPTEFQAPEQRRDVRARPSAPTDAYQVAAIAYRFVMGQAPHATHPLPIAAGAGAVPEAVARAVDVALSADPGDRPEVRALGAAFRAANEIHHR